MAVPSTQLGYSNENTGDAQQNSIQSTQRKTQQYANSLGATPADLDAVTFTAGQQIRISHKLGRVPTEWWPRDVMGGYGSFQRISWDATYITIKSLNACTATFRIA